MKSADKKLFESALGKGFKAGWYAAHRTLADGLKAQDAEYATWLIQRGEKSPEVEIDELLPGKAKPGGQAE